MKLRVTYFSNIPGADAVWYHITPDKENPYEISALEKMKLKRLHSKISKMAERVLGDEFIRVDFDFGGILTLGVNKGVATGPKKDGFRSLRGWIELCDEEGLP
ncbi:MAG: hypothetical protein AAB618_01610 [Patescibacteria group bacterium]